MLIQAKNGGIFTIIVFLHRLSIKFGILYLLVAHRSHIHASSGRFSTGALVAALTIAYGVGIWIGAALFSHVQPRSFLRFHRCEQTCLRPNEITGLIAAVGIQKIGGELPLTVAETEKSIAFLHPVPQDAFHVVIVPKRDIKDVGTLTPAEEPYLIDAYALIQEIVRTQKLSKYRVTTNGPGFQKVGYLHFHLLGQGE